VGSCACAGLPAGQRNLFDNAKKAEIEALLVRFAYAPMVRKVSDIVPIDGQVPGCPMSEEGFLRVLHGYLTEFGIEKPNLQSQIQ